ncbi:Filamin-B, partial [Manis pentadactyla]
MVDANGYGEETGYGVGRDTVRFASYSDVSGEGQIDLHYHGVASVTSMLTLRVQTKVKCQILAPGLRLALVVRFPKILAFRKVFVSLFDVTGSARWWIGFMGIRVSRRKVYAYDMVTERICLILIDISINERVSPGSDVTGSARWWISF